MLAVAVDLDRDGRRVRDAVHAPPSTDVSSVATARSSEAVATTVAGALRQLPTGSGETSSESTVGAVVSGTVCIVRNVTEYGGRSYENDDDSPPISRVTGSTVLGAALVFVAPGGATISVTDPVGAITASDTSTCVRCVTAETLTTLATMSPLSSSRVTTW